MQMKDSLTWVCMAPHVTLCDACPILMDMLQLNNHILYTSSELRACHHTVKACMLQRSPPAEPNPRQTLFRKSCMRYKRWQKALYWKMAPMRPPFARGVVGVVILDSTFPLLDGFYSALWCNCVLGDNRRMHIFCPVCILLVFFEWGYWNLFWFILISLFISLYSSPFNLMKNANNRLA